MLKQVEVADAIYEHFAGQFPGVLPDRSPDEQGSTACSYEGIYRAWYPDTQGRPGVVLAGGTEQHTAGFLHTDIAEIAFLGKSGLQPALNWLGIAAQTDSLVVESIGQDGVLERTVVEAGMLVHPSPEGLRDRGNALLTAEAGGRPRLQYELYTDQEAPTFTWEALRVALRSGRFLIASEPHAYRHDLTHLIGVYGVVEALPEPLESHAKDMEGLTGLTSLVGVLDHPRGLAGSTSRAYWRKQVSGPNGRAQLDELQAGIRRRIETTAQRLAALGLVA